MRISGCILLLTLLTPTGALADNMTVYNDATKDIFVDHQKENEAVEKIIWNSELQTKEGERIGMSAGTCQLVDTAENYYCSMILELDGQGLISATGVQLTEPQASTFVITGGTDNYRGITGKLILKPVEQRARFRFDLDYQLP